MAEMSKEQLKALGFQVDPAPAYSAEQLQAMGFERIPELPPAPPQVGAAETFINRGAGAVPAGNLLTNLISTGLLQAAKAGGVGEPGAVLTPQAQAELYKLGLTEDEVKDPGNPIAGPVDTYRRLREVRKERTAAGSKQNPTAARAGAALGTVATLLAPLPGVSVGTGVSGRLASSALTGAAYGALSGATDGEADLTRGQVRQFINDIIDRASGGAAVGLAAGAAGEVARPLWRALRASAIDQGRKVLQGGSDIAAATRKPVSDEAVGEVLASDGIRPLSTTQATHQRVSELTDESGHVYNEILKELEARGVKGAEVVPLANALYARYTQEFAASGADKAVPRQFLKEARNLEDVARGSMGQGSVQGPVVPQLGLQQSEAIKRALQKGARYDRLRASSTEEAKQEIASMLRQANEDAVTAAGKTAPPGSETRALADSFVPVKQRTGRLLEAQAATERAAAKADQRGNVSLKDYLLGASTGDPVSALATALVSGLARNRLPSAGAAGTYALSQALRNGTLAPRVARTVALASQPTMTDISQTITDWLAGNTSDDRSQALIDALRRK